MERLTLEDMIKALKCVASQDVEGDCYMDHENFNHMEDDNYKRLICGTGDKLKDYISGRDAVGCPYHQKTYGTCYEDGELYWLKDVAELLEELKSYKEAEEQGLLVRLPCKVGDILFRINKGARNPIIKMKVSQITMTSKSYNIKAIEEDYGEVFFSDVIGIKVFLTREEAEKKLEEVQNDKT